MRGTLALLLLITAAANAATVNNDDTCDIAVMPAATLLLPYFEVDSDKASGEGQTTIFTVINNVNLPQAAHVTLWTDYGYPVINFNLFLTGYDVQSVNLYDVIARGLLAPDEGTGLDVSPVGELSGDVVRDDPFNNPTLDEGTCVDLPVVLPQVYLTRLRSAFTTGKVPAAGASPACNTAGDAHRNAVGYATIDVAGLCSTTLPTQAEYFKSEIRFDNVLTGDYIQLDPSQDFAQGGPMVHIRAIPEGGTPRTRAGNPDYKVNLPRTFYSRYLPAGLELSDARQPLPATFYARWIDGGPLGINTSLKIWREGRSNATTACSAYPAAGRDVGVVELTRFDEEENFETLAPEQPVTPVKAPLLPAASLVEAGDESIFPESPGGAAAGWLYLNLDAEQRDGYAGQNWVISSMRAEDRFAVDVDAVALGNGCAAAVPPSEAAFHQPDDAPAIGPAQTADAGCDISTMPAATLLLPYFEVDLSQPAILAENTIFTISNTGRLPQIAQVTLWTDYAYPVVEFSIFLTGYDVHTVNLYDLLSRGETGNGTGFDVSPVGDLSGFPSVQVTFDNETVDESSCVNLPAQFPPRVVERMQAAFTTGRLPPCQKVGGTHRNAIGYATIDVVGACSPLNPTDGNYFDLIRFDNVLTGDYMQLNGENDSAEGGQMVHIRAIPGGDMPRTFYSRFQDPSAPADARQPLPSTFNARWIAGAFSKTYFKIWREGRSPASSVCGKLPANGTLGNVELVRFDEEENPTVFFVSMFPGGGAFYPSTLPAASRTDTDNDAVLPPNEHEGAGGWMYLNLDVSERDAIASQNWVISSMRVPGRFSIDIDAAALGNGCSAPVRPTEALLGDGKPIGPSPNHNP